MHFEVLYVFNTGILDDSIEVAINLDLRYDTLSCKWNAGVSISVITKLTWTAVRITHRLIW